MSKIEYCCTCFNRDNDVTYEAQCETQQEAIDKVNYFRDLIKTNGETDEHSRIEVRKSFLDEDDEEIDSKVLKKYSIT